jgi:hypothetical protein
MYIAERAQFEVIAPVRKMADPCLGMLSSKSWCTFVQRVKMVSQNTSLHA